MRVVLIAAAIMFAAPAHAEPLAPGVLDFDIVEGSVRQAPCVSAHYGSPSENVVCVEYARSDSQRIVAAYREAIRAEWTQHDGVYIDAHYSWYTRVDDGGQCTVLQHNFGPRESNQDWIAANVPELRTNDAIHRALTDMDRRYTMLFRWTSNGSCDADPIRPHVAPARAEPLAPGVLDFEAIEGSMRLDSCLSATAEISVCVGFARADAQRIERAYAEALRASGWTAHVSVRDGVKHIWYTKPEGDGQCTSLYTDYAAQEGEHAAPGAELALLFLMTPNDPCIEP